METYLMAFGNAKGIVKNIKIGQSAAKFLMIFIRKTFIDYPGREYIYAAKYFAALWK